LTRRRTRTPRILGPLCLAVAIGILASSSATALAAPIDRASDHVALRAFNRYVKATLSRIPASKRSDESYVHSIAARCRNVLARLASRPVSAVNKNAVKAFVEETVFDLTDKANGPLARPLQQLGHTLSTTRWSTRRTAATVGAFIVAQRKVFALAPPDLCADARAFVANPHATPHGTKRWVAKFTRTSRAANRAGFAFGEVLGFFHGPADVGALNELGRLSKRLTAADKRLESAEETHLLGALGLHS
jgi:hypothetical protein